MTAAIQEPLFGLAVLIQPGPVVRKARHEWGISITHPGDGFGQDATAEVCLPTVESVDWRCDCGYYRRRDIPYEPCQCVGDLMYRGACLHCDWKGTAWSDENTATEDAHDHTWPGWRELPVVDKSPERGTSKGAQTAIKAWVARLTGIGYPPGWLERGGPIRTRRQPMGTRSHVGTPFGGYDLCGEVVV